MAFPLHPLAEMPSVDVVHLLAWWMLVDSASQTTWFENVTVRFMLLSFRHLESRRRLKKDRSSRRYSIQNENSCPYIICTHALAGGLNKSPGAFIPGERLLFRVSIRRRQILRGGRLIRMGVYSEFTVFSIISCGCSKTLLVAFLKLGFRRL